MTGSSEKISPKSLREYSRGVRGLVIGKQERPDREEENISVLAPQGSGRGISTGAWAEGSSKVPAVSPAVSGVKKQSYEKHCTLKLKWN